MNKTILCACIWLLISGCKKSIDEVKSSSENGTIINHLSKIDLYKKKDRKIRIYLPPSYNNTNEEYPVIYLMDGQNLFYDSTSYVGEWHIDETMDRLIQSGLPESIIVGVDHGNEHRLIEYNPYDHPEFGTGEGKEFMDWFVTSLIPEIESKYRIMDTSIVRGIGGASMGGLISLYAISRYPDVFAHAALFSVSFPIAPQALEMINELNQSSKVYFVTGQKEGEIMVRSITSTDSILFARNFNKKHYFTRVVPNGEHNEKLWEIAFADYYNWITSSW